MTEPPRRPRPVRPSPEPPGDDQEHDEMEPTSDRPTVNPPFDVEAFARTTTASHSSTTPSPPERTYPVDAPTARPPAPEAQPTAAAETRSERITLTNEAELEKALAKSVASNRRDPPPRRTESPRTSSSSALSIANARAPSAPEMPAARQPTASSIEAAVLGAIGSTGPEITERTIEDPGAEMRERFSLGDYTGALEMAELLLTEDPDDAEAVECAASCRSVLESMYAARLGRLNRIPSVILERAQLRWLSIDHRAGFVLSLIDGSSTLEMILDVCGMPRLDAMRILHELVRQNIVVLKG